jgi:hypothetical protein
MPAPRGRPQRGHEAFYDPTSGLPYRPGPTFRGHDAAKLVAMAKGARITVSELLNELVRREPVDQDGRPLWAIDEDKDGRLPLGRGTAA